MLLVVRVLESPTGLSECIIMSLIPPLTWFELSLRCEPCRGQLTHPAALTVAQQAVQLQLGQLGADGGNLKAAQLLLTAGVCGKE